VRWGVYVTLKVAAAMSSNWSEPVKTYDFAGVDGGISTEQAAEPAPLKDP